MEDRRRRRRDEGSRRVWKSRGGIKGEEEIPRGEEGRRKQKGLEKSRRDEGGGGVSKRGEGRRGEGVWKIGGGGGLKEVEGFRKGKEG